MFSFQHSRRSYQGLTLPEIIISILILSFLGAVIYATVSQSLRLWQRATEERPEFDIDLFVEKLKTDLRNAYTSNARSFSGEEATLEFDVLDAYTSLQWPRRVFYFFDEKNQFLRRGMVGFDQVLLPS